MKEIKYVVTNQSGNLYARYDEDGNGESYSNRPFGCSHEKIESLPYELKEVFSPDLPKFAWLLNPGWCLYEVVKHYEHSNENPPILISECDKTKTHKCNNQCTVNICINNQKSSGNWFSRFFEIKDDEDDIGYLL